MNACVVVHKHGETTPKERGERPRAEPAAQPAAAPAAEPEAKAEAPAVEAKPAEAKPAVAAPLAEQKPQQIIVPPPAEEPAAAAKTVPAAPSAPAQPPLTNILIPAAIPFDQLVSRVDALVPKTEKQGWTLVTKPDDSPRVEVKYEVWREPIKASFSEQTLHITVPLLYAATVRAKAKNPIMPGKWLWITEGDTWGTKAEPQHITATVHVKLSIDDAWKIKAETKLEPFVHGAPPSGQVCLEKGIKICMSKASIAPQVRERMNGYLMPRLERALKGVNQKIEQAYDLKAQAQKLWNQMQHPVSLQKIAELGCPEKTGGACKPGAWLVVQPSAVGVGQPRMDGKDLCIDLSIAGRLWIATGARPSVKLQSFPNIQPVKEAAGFRIAATIRLAFESLGAVLDQQLKGKSFGAKGKPQLVVKSARVQARAKLNRDNHLVIALSLGGAAEGEIYLVGNLAYDAAAQTLMVKNFDYTVETQNAFAKKLSGVDHEAFRKQVASKARWDLSPQIARLKQALSAGLNQSLGGQVGVSGDLSQLDLKNISVEPGLLSADLIVGGALKLTYTPAK